MDKINTINQSIIKEFSSEGICHKLNEKRITKILGYEEETVPGLVTDSIKTAFNDIPQLLSLKGGYKIIDPKIVSFSNDQIKVADIYLNTKNIISFNLKHSETLAIIVATIGDKITNYLSSLMENGDTLTGYIADQIASELVECWADDVENELEKSLSQLGMKITNRYSPGYCGWDVSDQHNLFSLLPEKFCGINLTDNALMIPIKSISAVIGIGKNVERKDYQCSICNMEFCYKRGRNE